MFRKLTICGLLLAGTTWFSLADDKHDHHAAASVKNAGFDKMKSLVGTWVVADKDGKPTDQVASVFKLTAGGTAIQETIFPGQDHEMVSLYTAEGPDLILTHYCMLGNQPRMKANTKSLTNKLVFEFAGGTNLDPKKDKHMHGKTLTFVDPDHIELNGVGWENGGPAKEMCGIMNLVRKK